MLGDKTTVGSGNGCQRASGTLRRGGCTPVDDFRSAPGPIDGSADDAARQSVSALETAQWYALRTRARHEMKVRDRLLERGVEVFLPLYERWSRWKDRNKQLQAALFPGYCFARFAPTERVRVLTVAGVA